MGRKRRRVFRISALLDINGLIYVHMTTFSLCTLVSILAMHRELKTIQIWFQRQESLRLLLNDGCPIKFSLQISGFIFAFNLRLPIIFSVRSIFGIFNYQGILLKNLGMVIYTNRPWAPLISLKLRS